MSRTNVSTQPPSPLRFDFDAGLPRSSRPPALESAPPTAPHRHPLPPTSPVRPAVVVATRDRGSLFRLKLALHDRADLVIVRSVEQVLSTLDAVGPRAILVIDLSAPSLDPGALADALDTHFPTLPALIWGEIASANGLLPLFGSAARDVRRLPTRAAASEVARALADLL